MTDAPWSSKTPLAATRLAMTEPRPVCRERTRFPGIPRSVFDVAGCCCVSLMAVALTSTRIVLAFAMRVSSRRSKRDAIEYSAPNAAHDLRIDLCRDFQRT